MDLRTSWSMMLILILIFLTGCSYGNLPPGPGPRLLSETETKKLVTSQAGLTSVTALDMSTAGPVYRVVFGVDANNIRKVIWVSDHIEYQENLDKGISREDAMKIARKKGFDDSAKIQLIYVSPEAKQKTYRQISNSSNNVFWWIRTPEAEITHQMFLNFYDGTVVYEWKK